MAHEWTRPDDYDDIPRPLVSVGKDYPPSFELATHVHGRGQLLYAAKGAVVISTPAGSWVAPPERAVWTPVGVPHAVRMVGKVSTRSVLLDAETSRRIGDDNMVLAVTPLLRGLLIAASDMPLDYDEAGRDGKVVALLIAELERAERVPLATPMPADRRMAALCQAFIARPAPHDTIDAWAARLGMDRRAFTRRFRRETGLSFGAWRQQACVLAALPWLAEGKSVTAVALDLGYDSPAAFSTMFRRLIGVSPTRYAASQAA